MPDMHGWLPKRWDQENCGASMQAHIPYRLHDGMGLKIRNMPVVQGTNIIKVMNFILLTLTIYIQMIFIEKRKLIIIT